MKADTRHFSRFLAPALLASAIGAGGCQWAAPQTRPGDLDVDRVDRATLQEEYRRMSAYVGGVEAEREAAHRELAARMIELENAREAKRLAGAELEATLIDLHYLESQFINLEDRLTQEESKATAVSAMADAQLVYDRVRQSENAALSSIEWKQVDERMTAAEDAVTRNNFTAAVYYAQRAMRLLDRSERESKSFLASGVPHVVSVATANYRKGPGAEFPVVGQLTQGVVIVEMDRKQEWIRMKTSAGAEGWIHETLIR